MARPKNLKTLIKTCPRVLEAGDGIIAVPGAFNAASAMLIEKAGFKAVYISGAGLSNSNGLADTGLLTRADVKRQSARIINSVNIPAIVDVDTGFGGLAEVKKTVRVFETICASAIQIEDQVSQKRCGHLPGKRVIPAREFADKIRAAVSARKNRDFLIIARTDARAVTGMDDAILRARLYAKAGADVIFPEALQSRAEFLAFAKNLKGVTLMANMTEFGKTPYLTVNDFKKMGYGIVIFPMTAFRSAMKAMEDALCTLKTNGTQRTLLPKMQTRAELYELLKYKIE